MDEMSGKTCIVTGANKGIGRETATGLARMGADVVMVCRSAERGQEALTEVQRNARGGKVELMLADLESQAETRRLATDLKRRHSRLDVLVNNAGVLRTSRTLTVDGYETTFALNHLAYFLLTDLLLDLLKASAPSRIVNVSSSAHFRGVMDFEDLQGERFGIFRAYSQSKLANVLFTYELARRLEGGGVTANALHPGVVASGFGRDNRGLKGRVTQAFLNLGRPFMLNNRQGAETSLYLACSPEVEGVSGKYFDKRKAVRSSPASYDEDIARRLWEVSAELTGVAVSPVRG